ncbi:ANK3-like protein [Mya arenaria]|uniref:ANK3-like protein n=1 Tax=Mya arenaria TaxID=6604 RepID=A0ABY7DLW5_MYAAR|nr:uncharacterized protein LOC128225172 [Mya arenaria]WAQ97063.1 ANK3-like protein [Mya arenaria]
MSRGPRDLRDLICVSRLTFRESDEEVISDDDRFHGDWDEISLESSGSCDSRQGSTPSTTVKGHSPDSGCITNGNSPADSTAQKDAELKLDLTLLSKVKKKSKKKKKKVLETDAPRFPFPKPAPLPPLRSGSVEHDSSPTEVSFRPAPPASDCKSTHSAARHVASKPFKTQSQLSAQTHSVVAEATDHVDEESEPVRAKTPFLTYRAKSSDADSGNYDVMLSYMDATVVSGWLTKANNSVSEIAAYIAAGDHFVQFAHFWLTDFGDTEKREIFELEIDILKEELGFAFAIGREERKVSQRDINNLIGAIFREYPKKLLSGKGAHLFLDYLDIITSGRTQKYKQLLSDVKCSTKNKQYAQWLLATRSYSLVSMWCAIINFYRNLLGRHGTVPSKVPDAPSTFKTVYEKRLFQALRHGYRDVIHYLHVGKYVDLTQVDSHERTLIFTAVMHNQPRVLQYLVKATPSINVNHVSNTGNTALHAAVNAGSAQLVSALLKAPGLNVDCVNLQCENAAPIHLAVMHGHAEIVGLLLKAGVDTSLKMGDLTPLDIARDFEHAEILELLTEHIK